MADIKVIDFTNTHLNGNSYVSLEHATQFLIDRGVDVVGGNVDVSLCLLKAIDFIDSYENNFIGERLAESQPLAFPRVEGYTCGGVPRLLNVANLTKAVLHAVNVVANGADLSSIKLDKDDFIIEEQIDVLKQKYSDKYAKSVGDLDSVPMVARYLNEYFKGTKNPRVGR